MGKLALAAKITHVPSMYLSELDGPHKGCRQSAIDGHHEIGRRCRALGVDTIVVFDTHWLVNSGYHINCAPRFDGIYTSNELPHFIRNMSYEYPGNPELGIAIAEAANAAGIGARAHHDTTLELQYGTLVPMRYMNADQHFKVVSVAGWCDWHRLDDSRRFGARNHAQIRQSRLGNVDLVGVEPRLESEQTILVGDAVRRVLARQDLSRTARPFFRRRELRRQPVHAAGAFLPRDGDGVARIARDFRRDRPLGERQRAPSLRT